GRQIPLRTLSQSGGGSDLAGERSRTSSLSGGLGLARIGPARQLGSLSGGEQARLGIACLIAASPEVVLLDEPTNQLDGAALD
ncbi:ATP-binding cassette domain-containing protein, partial [Streptomyces sp. NPDC015032]|uniref:ATP-binding cassette domain-containing protein n=1 Tax=Streptomyces sp. NPDC015032 TaxID=3364937 RepID=UPI0037022511